MIPKLDTILFATDLSEASRSAYAHAAMLADRFASRLIIAYVIEPAPPSERFLINAIIGEDRWEGLRQDKEEYIIQSIRERIGCFCREAADELPECPYRVDDIRVLSGRPAREILDCARAENADVIVVAAAAGGEASDTVPGVLIRRSDRPVYVIPAGTGGKDGAS